MGRKGFTLIEVVATLVIISIIVVAIVKGISPTLSSSKEEAYNLMKKNIITASYNYVDECEANLINCNFSFDENNRFTASVLSSSGYFKDLTSPIDNKDLGNCLIIEAIKDNGVVKIDLIDNCY